MKPANKVHPRVSTFHALMSKAGAIQSSGSALLTNWDLRTPNGNAGHTILYYNWESEGNLYEETITEQMVVDSQLIGSDLKFSPTESEEFTLEVFDCVPLQPNYLMWEPSADFCVEIDNEVSLEKRFNLVAEAMHKTRHSGAHQQFIERGLTLVGEHYGVEFEQPKYTTELGVQISTKEGKPFGTELSSLLSEFDVSTSNVKPQHKTKLRTESSFCYIQYEALGRFILEVADKYQPPVETPAP